MASVGSPSLYHQNSKIEEDFGWNESTNSSVCELKVVQ